MLVQTGRKAAKEIVEGEYLCIGETPIGRVKCWILEFETIAFGLDRADGREIWLTCAANCAWDVAREEMD